MSRGRRLGAQEVAEVRARAADGISDVVIAEAFGINRATVARYTHDIVRPRKAGGLAVAEAPDTAAVDERLLERARALSPVDRIEDARRPAREVLAERNAAIRASIEPAGALARHYGISEAHVSRIRQDAPKPLSRRQELEAVAAGAWRAACMDDDEWAHWVSTNPTSMQESELAPRPCTDCPLGFAAEMRALGRCNGTPGAVQPREDEEDEPMEAPRDPGPPRVIPNGHEVTVALEAPCGQCAHEPVCAIRRSLISIETLPVQVPRFDRALSVALTAKVDCSHFLAVRKGGRPRKLVVPVARRERAAS